MYVYVQSAEQDGRHRAIRGAQQGQQVSGRDDNEICSIVTSSRDKHHIQSHY